LINTKDYTHARQELEEAQSSSEKLAVRLETARIHYLLGDAMRLSGSPDEASQQYQLAHRSLEEISKDPGAEHLLERFDLRTMFAESGRPAVAAK
jgi:hypothetical protein